MKFKIACSSCKKPLQFGEEAIGHKIRCPHCRQVMAINAPKPHPAAAPRPPAAPQKPAAAPPKAASQPAARRAAEPPRSREPAVKPPVAPPPAPPKQAPSTSRPQQPDVVHAARVPDRPAAPPALRVPLEPPVQFHTDDSDDDAESILFHSDDSETNESAIQFHSDDSDHDSPAPASTPAPDTDVLAVRGSPEPAVVEPPIPSPPPDVAHVPRVQEIAAEPAAPRVPPVAPPQFAAERPPETTSPDAAAPTTPPPDLTEPEADEPAFSPPVAPAVPAHDPILSAGMLGQFQIREVLGQGAFGTVYRALDPVLDRDVAVKTPRAGVTDAEHAARLIDEAKAAAKLRHPNIVAVYEAGAAGDDLFIASEYVAGQTLAERLRRDRIEPRQAAEWVRSLAEALAYAHDQEVVHSDVKPQNVMLNEDGRVQLMDFGLATRADAAISLDASAPDAATGVVGTPAYMSPEQASGQDAGPAGDQYSLGVVLYELLTGRTPFGGESSGGTTSTSEILQKVREQNPPRVRSVRRHVARDLASVCEKAIARDPRRRYSNCQEFADDLGRWITGELVQAHRYSPPELAMYWARRHPAAFGWIAAAACLLFALLGAGVTVGVQALASNGEASSRTSGSNKTASTTNDRTATTPTNSLTDRASNDSENYEAEVLAYARLLDRARCAYHEHEIIKADEYLEQTRWDFRDWEYAYLRRLITGGWRTFHGHRMAVTAVAFHPNGQRVASASADGTVRVWNVVTGDEVAQLQHNAAVTGVAFSADGKHVITTEGLIEQTQSMFGPSRPMTMPASAPAAQRSPHAPREVSGLVHNARRANEGSSSRTADLVDRFPHAEREDYDKPATRAVAESIEAARQGRDGRLALAQQPAVPTRPAPTAGQQPVPAGEPVAAPQERYRIQIWDAESGERIAEFERLAPNTPLVGLALSPDGSMLATAANTAASHDPNAPQPIGRPAPQAEVVPAPTTCEPTEPEIESEQVPAPAPVPPPQGPGGAVPAPAVAPPGGDIELWDLATRKLVRTIAVPHIPPRQIAWSADGKFIGAALAGGFGSGGFRSWSAATGDEATGLPGDFGALAFPIEGERFAAAPTQNLRLLEQGRRRSEGTDSEVRFWPFLQLSIALPPGGPPGASRQPGEPVPGMQAMMPAMTPDQSDSSMPLAGLPAAARSIAFSPGDAPMYGQPPLAVGGGDALLVEREGNIRLWNPSFDPMGHADLWGHSARVNAVAYRADGKQIVTGGADGVVKVWTAEVAPEVILLREYTSATRVAFSRDGRFLAVGHRAKHWTASRGFGEFTGQPMPPGGGPGGPEPQPDNIKIHDVRNGRELLKLASPGGDVVGLVFHPRGDWLAAATSDGTVTLWNIESGQSIATLRAPPALACLDVSPDGEFIAGGCTQARSASEGMPTQPGVAPPPAPAPSVAPAPVGAPQAASPRNPFSFVSLASRATVDIASGVRKSAKPQGVNTSHAPFVIWRVSDKSVAATIPAHADGVVSVAFSVDGKRLASSGLDDCVRLWDIAAASELLELEAHDGTVVDLAFRLGSDDIAGAVMRLPCRPGYPGDVVIWDAATGKKRHVIPAHAEAAYSVAYSRDGRRLASCGGAPEGSLSQPGEVKVWHADTGIELLPLAGSAGRDTKQGFYFKEQTYTTMKPVFETVEKEVERDGKTVIVQEVHTKMVNEHHVRKVPGGNSRVWWEVPGAATDVAFSDDGYRLAAACEDGTARIWDGFVCQPHDSAREPGFSANAIADPKPKMCSPSESQIAASPDGRWIVVADSAGNQCDPFSNVLRVYDAKTGRVVREIGPLENSARSISMSPNNRWVAVALNWAQMSQPMVQQPDGSFKPAGPPPKPIGGRIDVWDVTTGERVSEFNGHKDGATGVAFDPSGERVVSGGGDGLRLWDAKSGSEIKAVKTAAVLGVAWSSDRSVVFLSWGGHGAAAPVRAALAPTVPVRLVSWPGNGNPLPKELSIWDVEDAAPPRTLKALTDNIMLAPHPLAFDAATRRAIVACTLPGENDGERGQLHFIPIDKPDSSQVQTLGRGMLWSVAVSGDSKRLVTAGGDWCVNVWDAERRGRMLHLGGHIDDVRGAVFLPDGRVASVGADHQLKVWHTGDALDRTAACHETETLRKRTMRLRGPGWSNPSSLTAAHRTPLAATAEFTVQQQPPRPPGSDEPPPQPKYDGVVRMWNTESAALRGTINVPGVLLNDVALTADVSHLAVAGADGVVKIFKLDGAEEVAQCRGHQGPAKGPQYRGTGATSIAFHPDGQSLASSGQDGTIRVWNLAGQEQFQLTPGAGVTRLAFHPDGTMLAAGFADRTVRLWSLADRKEIRTLKRHYGSVTDLKFNADGSRLAVTSTRYDYERQRWTGDLKVWDVASGRRIVSTPAHTWHDAHLAFHPTLPHIAIGSGIEHTVQVRHAETGSLVLSIPTSGYEVGGLAFNNAGDRLIFSQGGEVLLMDATPEHSPLGSAAVPAGAAATQSAADESAARWVLEKGGRIHVRSDGVVDEIANAADLPTDPFVVTGVFIGGRGDITDADAAVLHPLENLTKLHLNVSGVSDAAFEGLASLKNLREVRAEGSQVTGSFLSAFRDRKQLVGLSLAGSKLTDAGVQNLADNEIPQCSLYDTAITDAAMPVLKQVVTGGLSIARTKITDAGLTQLAGFRGNNLIIDGTAVTDAGLRTFLASKPPLHQFSIAHTAATDTIIDALAEIKTLQSVSLQGTKVTAEGAARLKAALPNCNVQR